LVRNLYYLDNDIMKLPTINYSKYEKFKVRSEISKELFKDISTQFIPKNRKVIKSMFRERPF